METGEWVSYLRFVAVSFGHRARASSHCDMESVGSEGWGVSSHCVADRVEGKVPRIGRPEGTIGRKLSCQRGRRVGSRGARGPHGSFVCAATHWDLGVGACCGTCRAVGDSAAGATQRKYTLVDSGPLPTQATCYSIKDVNHSFYRFYNPVIPAYDRAASPDTMICE